MYLDSGIIVKLLVREPDSSFFDHALSGHSLDSSELCLTEVASALLAKERAGAISGQQRSRAAEKFSNLLADEVIQLLPLDRQVLERATAILQACHPRIALRSLDAIHVATCDLHRCDLMCATDQRMRAAAAQLAIQIFPTQLDND